MGGVAGDYEDEGFDDFDVGIAGVGFEIDFEAFVESDAVFELDIFDFFGGHSGGVEVFAGDDGGFFDKAIHHGTAQGIVEDDVFERDAAFAGFDEGSGGEFES